MLLHGNGQIHSGVHRAGDFVRPWLVEGDRSRIARIGREARISQLFGRISIGDAAAAFTSANDMQATSVCGIHKLERHARFDRDSGLRKIGRGEVHMVYWSAWACIGAARSLATSRCPNDTEEQERKHKYRQLLHQQLFLYYCCYHVDIV